MEKIKPTIYLGSDHNGFKSKELVKDYLIQKNYQVKDLGNKKFQKTDDYPDYGKKVAKKVATEKNTLGILFCGSGQGMCIVANKYKGVRAALGWSQAAAKKSKHDDDSNVLCIPAWRLTNDQTLRITNNWLRTPFSNLTRHKRRINKINV